ncbi:MAG: hypothetical protein ACTSPA_04375, partial [Promethearchaeota archaeon]
AIGLAFIVWKDNRNPIDLGTLFLFLSAAIAITYTGVRATLINLGVIDSSYYIQLGLLDLGDLMIVFIASFYLWFILYLLGWSKLYSLPIVVGFYFAAHGVITGDNSAILLYVTYAILPVITGDNSAILLYVTYAILPSMIILLINSVKNKHGLSFTLAIMAVASVLIAVMAVASVLIAVVDPATIWAFLIKWFTGINIILGTNGWWDDHVFYDRDKRKNIQNVWIARMTTA